MLCHLTSRCLTLVLGIIERSRLNLASTVPLPADTAGLYIETLLSVPVALRGVVGEDSNVPPGGGVPVGVVVPLLWALVTTAIAVGVLACVDGRSFAQTVSAKLLIG